MEIRHELKVISRIRAVAICSCGIKIEASSHLTYKDVINIYVKHKKCKHVYRQFLRRDKCIKCNVIK